MLIDKIAAYWNGGRRDSWTDAEALEMAVADINKLVNHVSLQNDAITTWKNNHQSLLEIKNRVSGKYGELMRQAGIRNNESDFAVEQMRTEVGTALDGIRTTLYAEKMGKIIFGDKELSLVDDIIQEVEALMDKLKIPYPLRDSAVERSQ